MPNPKENRVNDKNDNRTARRITRPKVAARAVQNSTETLATTDVKIHSFMPDLKITEFEGTAIWTDTLLENIDKGMLPEIQILPNLKIKQIKSFIESIKKSNVSASISDGTASTEGLEVEILE